MVKDDSRHDTNSVLSKKQNFDGVNFRMYLVNSIVKKISEIELFFLASVLIFGSLMVFLTPLGGGYDEDQHLIRAWQLSKFVFIPREMKAKEAKYPELFFELSYRKQPLVESIGPDFWRENKDKKLYDAGYYYRTITTRSVYSPPLLLPQAIVLRYLGIKYDLPMLTVYYASRFAGLISYLILAWIALRIIPFHKWVFLVLAMSPMAIYQASTISADSISNGIGFLFIAGCLAIYERKEIGLRESLGLLLLLALLFFTKINLVPLALLPFVIISPKKFKSKKIYLFLIFSALFLFAVEVVGWSFLASSSIHVIAQDGISFSGQLKHVLSHPIGFIQTLGTDLKIYGYTYFRQWIGVYGYDYGSVPGATYFFFMLSLILTLLIPDREFDRKVRIALIIFFFLLYIATAMIFYFTITAVGEKFVYGVQGRYFVPIVPLLFLPLAQLIKRKPFKAIPLFAALFSVGSLITYVLGLYFSFHVVCGTAYYNVGLCYQPFYKNFAPLLRSSPPVVSDTIFVQEFEPVCNGMTQVRVRINSQGNNKEGFVDFTIKDVASNTILIQSKAANTSLPYDDWYPINFSPDWESGNKKYTLTIRGDSQTNDGPLLAYSIKPEYPLGYLFENGILLDDDIIFQYGCLLGLERAKQTFSNETK